MDSLTHYKFILDIIEVLVLPAIGILWKTSKDLRTSVTAIEKDLLANYVRKLEFKDKCMTQEQDIKECNREVRDALDKQSETLQRVVDRLQSLEIEVKVLTTRIDGERHQSE